MCGDKTPDLLLAILSLGCATKKTPFQRQEVCRAELARNAAHVEAAHADKQQCNG